MATMNKTILPPLCLFFLLLLPQLGHAATQECALVENPSDCAENAGCMWCDPSRSAREPVPSGCFPAANECPGPDADAELVFTCTPASDNTDDVRVRNTNPFNALRVSSAGVAHCEGILEPNATATFQVDRSTRNVFFKWLAADGVGGWSTVVSAPLPELYKSSCGAPSGWPSLTSFPGAASPVCDRDKHCTLFPATPRCDNVTGTCVNTSAPASSSVIIRGQRNDGKRRMLRGGLEAAPTPYPQSCPLVGRPSPHYCSSATAESAAGGGRYPMIEVLGHGLYESNWVNRLCSSAWLGMAAVAGSAQALASLPSVSPLVAYMYVTVAAGSSTSTTALVTLATTTTKTGHNSCGLRSWFAESATATFAELTFAGVTCAQSELELVALNDAGNGSVALLFVDHRAKAGAAGAAGTIRTVLLSHGNTKATETSVTALPFKTTKATTAKATAADLSGFPGNAAGAWVAYDDGSVELRTPTMLQSYVLTPPGAVVRRLSATFSAGGNGIAAVVQNKTTGGLCTSLMTTDFENGTATVVECAGNGTLPGPVSNVGPLAAGAATCWTAFAGDLAKALGPREYMAADVWPDWFFAGKEYFFLGGTEDGGGCF